MLLAVALLATAVVVLRDDDAPSNAPRGVSVEGLEAAAAAGGTPIYWAGTGPGTRFELTRTPGGKAYVRYLPEGVEVADDRPAFLTVASYPQRQAYLVAESSSRRTGMRSEPTPGGGLAVWSQARPTNVYLAYPGTDHLVEVFSPDTGEARRLALAGRIGAVGEINASEPAPRALTTPTELDDASAER